MRYLPLTLSALWLATSCFTGLHAQGTPPMAQSPGLPPQSRQMPQATRPPESDLVTIHIRQASLKAEIARNEAQREHGLMDRLDLPDNAGMLFVLPKPEQATFWMKDTKIPLSIAYLDHDGTIVEIYDMQAEDLSITASKSTTICYALETNLHWFDLNGIHVGDKVDLSPHTLAEFQPQ